MSISYYAIPVRDRAAVGPILEGEKTDVPIDSAKIRASLRKTRWEQGNEYVFVNVLATHVEVTHNPGQSEEQMEFLMDVLWQLQKAGLHVYDPQQGDWYPG